MQLNPDTMDRVLREFARDLADARRAEVERLRLILYELELLRDGVTEVVAEARAEVRVSIAELRIAQANNDKIKLLDLPRLPRPHMNWRSAFGGKPENICSLRDLAVLTLKRLHVRNGPTIRSSQR
jgi:hypothetical protein